MLNRLSSIGPSNWGRQTAMFLVACLLTLGLETLGEHAIQSGDLKEPGFAPSVFELSGIYQRIVASGPRKPMPRFTATVAFDPLADPKLSEVCQQRGFLAEVIQAVADFSPAVIVVDKYFVAKCTENSRGTVALRKAIQKVGRSIPIIVGRRVRDPAPAAREARADAPPRLLPAVDLGRQVKEGVLNVDPDTRRLPLGWTVLTADDKAGWRETLALRAAEAYDPKLREKYPLLDSLIARRQNPYISFLSRGDVETYAGYSAEDLLCGSAASRQRMGKSCTGNPRADLDYLRGRIVIIGEINYDLDAFLSVVGQVTGFVLQANYIEALLDQRYFKPVAWWVNYAAGFLIYLAFHWILVRHHQALEEAAGWRAALVFLKACGWAVVVIAGTAVVLYLIVMHAGWYVNPATMGLVVLIMKLAELIFVAVPHGKGVKT